MGKYNEKQYLVVAASQEPKDVTFSFKQQLHPRKPLFLPALVQKFSSVLDLSPSLEGIATSSLSESASLVCSHVTTGDLLGFYSGGFHGQPSQIVHVKANLLNKRYLAITTIFAALKVAA